MSFRLALRLTSWVCLVNALTSLAFSTIALAAQDPGQTGAGYAFTRSLPLALVALAAAILPRYSAQIVLASVLTLMQLGDACIGFTIHDPMKAWGPLALGILTAVSGILLYRSHGAASVDNADQGA